jgi:8-oxo-dGTP pyrophosphatase MutT (NUDIX family)
LFLLAAGTLLAQVPQPLALRWPLADKNFYLLTRLEGDPRARAELSSDAALRELATAKREAVKRAASGCALDRDCYLGAVRWKDVEIEAVSGRLRNLVARGGVLRSLAAGPLRDSGVFIRFHAKNDADLIVEAWKDAAVNLNRVIGIYGEGKPPRYPAIDSAVYDTGAENFRRLIAAAMGVLDDGLGSEELFFTPSLRFAIELMRIHQRDEAGRHEPLEAGENRAAYQAIPRTRWQEYPYTAIVVPGAGGDRPGVRLSAAGRLRIALAAERWRQRKAPFVVVSGGYVHPNQTPFAEAIEMKRALVEELGLPESAIVIDPHARHTTTNLRNAARLLFRYGVPVDRPALVTTDTGQSAYIESEGFAERCRKELGYLPYRLGRRLSRFDQEFWPLLDSLHADAVEPLDP